MRFDLRPSPLLAIAIVAAHSLAGACAWLVLPGWKGAALALALFALGLAAAWSRALLRAAHSVRAVELGGAEPLFHLRNGERVAAPVGERRYVSRYLVTLPLRRPLNRTLLVTADMLAADQFRRLRIWVRWNRLPGTRLAVAPAQLPA